MLIAGMLLLGVVTFVAMLAFVRRVRAAVRTP